MINAKKCPPNSALREGLLTPSNVTDFFIKASDKRNHETRFSRFSYSGKFYIRTSRLNQNQRSFASFRAKLWNSFSLQTRKLPKHAFKKQIKQILFSIVKASILIRLLLYTKTVDSVELAR